MISSKAKIAVAVGLSAVATAALAGSASGGLTAPPDGPKIRMVGGIDGPLAFKGPGKIEKGERLTIVNYTDPSQVGPHTFTLIRHLPQTKQEFKNCFKPGGACADATAAHKVDGESVGRPNVDMGRKGWDKSWGDRGDSQLVDELNEYKSRVVRAKAGALHYICLVHPEMQGTIKVLAD